MQQAEVTQYACGYQDALDDMHKGLLRMGLVGTETAARNRKWAVEHVSGPYWVGQAHGCDAFLDMCKGLPCLDE